MTIETSKVVGVTFEGRQEILARIYVTEEPSSLGKHIYKATLVREPHNTYDPNAVAVWCDGEQIGYLPGDVAKGVSFQMKEAGLDEVLCAVKIDVSSHKGWGTADFFAVVSYEIPLLF